MTRAMTVTGPVSASALGVTLHHEHLLIDMSAWQAPPRTPLQAQLANEPLRMDMLGEVRRDALVFRDNLLLDDIELAIEEVGDFQAVGGRTVVDVTVRGLGRNVRALREIADRTGLNVIAGCGYYIQQGHPRDMGERTVAELVAEFVDEITSGIDGTGILPGVIGEIGTGEPVHPDEWKVLEAACIAQRETGLPLYVHVFPAQGGTAPEVVSFVLGNGVAPDRLVVCHMDGNMDVDYQLRVAETGVYLAYDCFGVEVYFDSIDRYRCHDSERERVLLALLEAGYADQLLLSQDIAIKSCLKRFGGYGYSHVVRHIVPALERRGVDRGVIDTLLVENPARVLTIG